MKQTIHTSFFIILCLLVVGSPARTPYFKDFDSYERYADSSSTHFQNASRHSMRTIAYLKPLLDSIETDFTNIFNMPEFRSSVKFRSLSVVVKPSGRIAVGFFDDFINIDSMKFKDADSYLNFKKPDSALASALRIAAKKYHTDSIANYEAFFVIKGKISNATQPLVFSIFDTSYYAPERLGSRSKASVFHVVMKKMNSLNKIYRNRLRYLPNLHGKISVKFVVGKSGHVMFAKVLNERSTIIDVTMREEFIDEIKTWKFKRIRIDNDFTEVVFPFVLSN